MRYVIFLVFMFFVCEMYAQHERCFNVCLQEEGTKKLLRGVRVYAEELGRYFVSDDDGRVKICCDVASLHIGVSGYQSVLSNIVLTDTLLYFLWVRHGAIEHEEVVVTGVQGVLSQRRSSGSLLVMRQDDMFKSGVVNGVEMLNKQNGVALFNQGPGVYKVSIRGLSNNRVGIIQDGMKLENQQWGDDHGVDVDDLNLEKIEVLKWPTSLLYGSDAMGGVVNFITQQNHLSNSLLGNISTNYNSNNNYLSSHANLAANVNSFRFGAFGNIKRAQDYANKYDGYVLNSKFKENNFGFYFGQDGERGNWNFAFNEYDKTVGLIVGDRDSSTGRFVFKKNDNVVLANDADSKTYDVKLFPLALVVQRNVSARAKWIINAIHSVSIVATGQQNIRHEVASEADTALSLGLKTLNFNVLYAQHFLRVRNTCGLLGVVQENKIGGSEFLLPAYRSLEFAGVYIGEWDFNKNTAMAFGVRADYRRLASEELGGVDASVFEALNKTYFKYSANFGLVLLSSLRTKFKSNLSKGFRFPHVVELLSNGVHEGTYRFEVGTKTLQPEENYQVDASFEFKSNHLFARAEGFANKITNYIYLQKTVAPIEQGAEENPLQYFKYSQHDALIVGIELESDIHPHPIDWLHWGNKFSYILGVFDVAVDGTKNLPKIMSPIWASDLKATWNLKSAFVEEVFMNVDGVYNFSQNNFFGAYKTETATPAYFLVHVGCGIKFGIKRNTFCNLFFGVNNIFDVAYQNHLSSLKYKAINENTNLMGVFEMGRSVVVKLNIPIRYAW